ncbi:hypothetical protein FACS1894122_11650 [Alphaproteobacteria bacterium]|nr:hypothetical protein FACS1894122_11650 [Alphaproteobacteria bacterium]
MVAPLAFSVSLSVERYARCVCNAKVDALFSGVLRRYAPTTRVSLDDGGFGVFRHLASINVAHISLACHPEERIAQRRDPVVVPRALMLSLFSGTYASTVFDVEADSAKVNVNAASTVMLGDWR